MDTHISMKDWANIAKRERIHVFVCEEETTREHEHDFLELSYVLNGRANYTADGVTSTIQKGDYYIMDYHQSHTYTQVGDEPFTLINCLFIPRFIDETLKDSRELEAVVNNYLIKFDFCRLKGHPARFVYHDEDGHIGRLFHILHKECSEKSMGYLEIARCYLIAIIIEIMRQLQVPDSAECESKMVRYIIAHIQKNFMDKLSLGQIAGHFNYSLAHISHTFKKEAGMTFQEYVQRVRIREACRLLTNTDKKVVEIAALVGYSNIQFFNEVFRRQLGMSPRDFRRTSGTNQ